MRAWQPTLANYAMGNWLSGGTAQLRRGGSEHSSALALGGGVGGAGGGSGGCAVGELAPVGAFVVGSGSADGEYGGGGGVNAGGAQPLVLGPGRAVGAGAGWHTRAGCVLGRGAHGMLIRWPGRLGRRGRPAGRAAGRAGGRRVG